MFGGDTNKQTEKSLNNFEKAPNLKGQSKKDKTQKIKKIKKECNLETHDDINGKCLLKCKDGYTRNEKGRCVKNKTEKHKKECNLNTHDDINGKCILKCNDDEMRNEHDRCVKNPLLNKKKFKNVNDHLRDFKIPMINEKISTDKNISYIQRLERIGRLYENVGIDYDKWRNTYTVEQLNMFMTIYLIEKYGVGCMVYDNKNAILTLNLQEGNTNKIDYKYIKQIMNCIKDNKDVKNFVMIFRVSLRVNLISGHANILVYKSATNSIEQFEPHGSYYKSNKDTRINEQIVKYFSDMITTMNSINMKRNRIYYDRDIQYIKPYELCPYVKGLQTFNKKASKYDIEPGFCVMWSMFYAELSLLNPEIEGKEILSSILNWLKSKKNVNYAKNIMRGYTRIMMEEVLEYENDFINNTLNLQPDVLTKIKADPRKYFLNYVTNKYNEYFISKYDKINKTKYADIFKKPVSYDL